MTTKNQNTERITIINYIFSRYIYSSPHELGVLR